MKLAGKSYVFHTNGQTHPSEIDSRNETSCARDSGGDRIEAKISNEGRTLPVKLGE